MRGKAGRAFCIGRSRGFPAIDLPKRNFRGLRHWLGAGFALALFRRPARGAKRGISPLALGQRGFSMALIGFELGLFRRIAAAVARIRPSSTSAESSDRIRSRAWVRFRDSRATVARRCTRLREVAGGCGCDGLKGAGWLR
jgi:hypothetical protein